MAIKSWGAKQTESTFRGVYTKGTPKDLQERAHRKLLALHAATDLRDLQMPPSNRLEKLKGDRADQYSIRVNDQYRICFVWKEGDAYDVELVDYH